MKSPIHPALITKSCPYCGVETRIPASRMHGPWAFLKCSGCERRLILQSDTDRKMPRFSSETSGGPEDGAGPEPDPERSPGTVKESAGSAGPRRPDARPDARDDASPATEISQPSFTVSLGKPLESTLVTAASAPSWLLNTLVDPELRSGSRAQEGSRKQDSQQRRFSIPIDADPERSPALPEDAARMAAARSRIARGWKRVVDPLIRIGCLVIALALGAGLVGFAYQQVNLRFHEELASFEQGFEKNKASVIAQALQLTGPSQALGLPKGGELGQLAIPVPERSPSAVPSQATAAPAPGVARAEVQPVAPVAEVAPAVPQVAVTQAQALAREQLRQEVAVQAPENRGPSAISSALPQSPVAALMVRVRAPSAILRSGPGVSFAKVGFAPSSYKLQVIGGPRDNWFQVKTHAGTAWIRGDLVQEITTQ